MAAPDRVTDELVEVRHRFYSDPATQEALRAVFENAFAGVGPPRRHIEEEELGLVATPTLVLWTDRNPGTGPDVGRRIAEAIPGARFALIEDAAHWPLSSRRPAVAGPTGSPPPPPGRSTTARWRAATSGRSIGRPATCA